MGINRVKSNIAFAILEKLPFLKGTQHIFWLYVKITLDNFKYVQICITNNTYFNLIIILIL